MSIQTLNLFRVERWDGGDRQVPTNFYLRTPEDATAYKAANPHDYANPVTIILLGTLDDLVEAETERKRQQALAKLTPAEQRLLGLIK